MFFASPDWSFTKQQQKIDAKISLVLSLNNMISEEQVKATIKNRTRAKKVELIISRVILFTLNIALMGGCWVGIYYVNAYQIQISEYMKSKYSWLKQVANFIAPVCLTVINLLLPLLTNLIISLERWDYQSTVINNQIWRNFLAKEFNIILFFLINVDMIVPYDIIEGSSFYSYYKKDEFPCAEVQISVEFIKIIATDFVVNLVKHPIKFCLFWLLFECKELCSTQTGNQKRGGGSNSKKAELDISEVS